MRRISAAILSLIALAAFPLATAAHAADSPMKAEYLRVEYRVDPLGIDVLAPRLSWEVSDARRGAAQSAYQVLVASTPEKLAADQGDLWDSGKTASDRSIQIVYAGKPLASRADCHWKVRLWDKEGKPSEFSKPALWTMGLLKSEDWKAKWIGYDADPGASDIKNAVLAGGKWIWFPEGSPAQSAPAGNRFFRKTIDIPQGAKIKSAKMVLTVDDQFTLFVGGAQAAKSSGQTDAWRTPATVDLAALLKPGKNVLAVDAENSKESPAGLTGKLVVEFEQGPPLVVASDASWKTADKPADSWQKPDFDDASWAAAKEIAKVGDAPWGAIGSWGRQLQLPPPPYLRKEFEAGKAIRRATVHASALGIYQLRINGQPVGQDLFTPCWTDYHKRVYYNTYDVTNLVKQGPNAIGAMLADGWYAGYVGLGGRHRYGTEPRFMAQLQIELADGSTQTIVTDETWKASYGAWLEADMLMGEFYDATREMPGWDKAGFDQSAWQPVAVTESIKAKVQAYPGVTVQRCAEIKPKAITEPKPGVYVFDLGVNFAGFVRLKTNAPVGTKLVLRHAEVLNPDGTLYTANLRSARCTDTFVTKGGEVVWEPQFTFHGFRYVELTGVAEKPSADAITGIEITSATPKVGSFECSSAMVNQLYDNICRTQRANFIEVPTDCPQRDERLGWTGDAEVYIRTATYNMDVAAFFTKWLVDLDDAQSPAGAYPDVAPRVAAGEGTAAWADAGTICPTTIQFVYDDQRVIAEHYDAMVKWVEYCRKNSKDLLRPAAGYGDWLSINANTPPDVLGTAYFAYSTRLVADAAKLLGKNDDAKKYEALFEQVKEAFNKAYVAADGRIRGDTQSDYVMALWFDLLAPEKRATATRYLVENIKARQTHLSTGFIGTAYLMPTLARFGANDVAYKLLLNDTFPSWGYSIKHGATSIWERWDGWTAERGFQDPGMNSFAHYSFGAVARWMFQTVAGIDSDGPGFKRLSIRPTPGEGLSFVKASYRSIHGKIVSEWKIEGGKFVYRLVIPANTTAVVAIPTTDASGLTEGGKPIAESEGVRVLRPEGNALLLEVPAGEYQFAAPFAAK